MTWIQSYREWRPANNIFDNWLRANVILEEKPFKLNKWTLSFYNIEISHFRRTVIFL
jgi:hypothetical protein